VRSAGLKPDIWPPAASDSHDVCTVDVIRYSIITCPECGASAEEKMPTATCMFFYECKSCHKILRPLRGQCCVFCSFGSVKCPPIQLERGCCPAAGDCEMSL
jgi:hypothetical protein